MKGVAVTAIAALLLAAGPRETLTVTVTGRGSVTSHPAGVHCPTSCTLRVKKNAAVTLTAAPAGGARFSHWTTPCRTARTCTLKMTRSKRVGAVFVASAAPPAKAGHYTGTYTDGTRFDFDVHGATLTKLVFDFNGHCSNGGNLAGPLTTVSGSFPIGSDGTVAGHVALTYPNASGTGDFAGKLTRSGSGSGTLTINVSLSDGSGTCTSSGTWSVHTS